MGAWEGDPDETAQHIVEAGKVAIISMDALHRINQSFGKSGGAGSTHRKMVFNAGAAAGGESKSQAQRLAEDKAEQEQLQQQFQNLKNSMTSGKILTTRGHRGGKAKRHMLLAHDFRAVLFKNPSVKGSLGSQIAICDIRKCEAGANLHKLKKKSQEPLRFFIESVKAASSVDCWCDTQAERDRWVEAINLVCTIYRKYRDILPTAR